jgi:hypothetical protein
MTFIKEIEKIIPKVHMEAQKTMTSRGIADHKEGSWRYNSI